MKEETKGGAFSSKQKERKKFGGGSVPRPEVNSNEKKVE
jgi:hypothetical protein